MAKRQYTIGDTYILKRQREAKEERADKIKKSGKIFHTCKNCGQLPIERFYLTHRVNERTKEEKYIPEKYCKICQKSRRPSMGLAKREVYSAKQRPKQKAKYNQNREVIREASRSQQQYARDNLTDSYIRKRIRVNEGIPSDKITKEMITKKREELREKRARLERGEVKKGSKHWNAYIHIQKEQLTDVWIKNLIRRNFKGEITKEMIEERRKKVQEIRRKKAEKKKS